MKDTTKGKGKTPRRFKDLTPDEYREEKKTMLETLCKYFDTIMHNSKEGKYYWDGTMSDLFELTHTVWLEGSFTDSTGRPLTFKYMANYCCEVFHRRQVARPYALVLNAKKRKGVRELPILDRYIRLAVEQRISNPMKLDVKCYKFSPKDN